MNDIVVSLPYIESRAEYCHGISEAGEQSAFVHARTRPTVVALGVGRKAIAKRYGDRTRALQDMAADLPDRPSPGDIHDLRVAARRIQMMRRIMPRSVRDSQGPKRFDLALRMTLKATSKLRDMDTLTDTLKSYGDSLPSGLLVNLENQRSDASARAKVAIGALCEIPAPELDASGLSGKRLSKKLRKGLRKHSMVASSLLKEALIDESKAAELHSLRKEVKRMRYLAELANEPPGRLLPLTKWQESLGAIHDIDVAIAYLKGVSADSGKTILELQRARHSKYLAFIREARTVRALGKEGALAAGGLGPADLNPAKG